MEYALVNIVMGDIADIEKKKPMGISSLLLRAKVVPIKQIDGMLNPEVCLLYKNLCGWNHLMDITFNWFLQLQAFIVVTNLSN